MHLKTIELSNLGPIEKAKIDSKFSKENTPLPLILVGTNGSGKSLVAGRIMKHLFDCQSELYPDSETREELSFIKAESTLIRHYCNYSKNIVEFEGIGKFFELILNVSRDNLPEIISGISPEFRQKVLNDDKRYYSLSKIEKANAKEIFDKSTFLYFPSNRFEYPDWVDMSSLRFVEHSSESDPLNPDPDLNLKSKDNPFLRALDSSYDRRILQLGYLNKRKIWLFDIFHRTNTRIVSNDFDLEYDSDKDLNTDEKLVNDIKSFLKLLFNEVEDNCNLRCELGTTHDKNINYFIDDKLVSKNLSNLSTGQNTVLDIFLGILMDHSKISNKFGKIDDYRGIVVIEDIDLHMHTYFQYKLLPRLLEFFPNIQFIITTHSPLFVMGMNEKFGAKNFQVFDLSQGKEVAVDEYPEKSEAVFHYFFNEPYFKKYIDTIKNTSKRYVVLVEGKSDKDFIFKAGQLLGKQTLLDSIDIIPVNSYSFLNNFWKFSESDFRNSGPEKIVLLYDCDTNTFDEEKGKMYKKQIPFFSEHPITKGIENLFSRDSWEKAYQNKNLPKFLINSDENYISTKKDNHKKIIASLV